MIFRDYKHIELLEEITIPAKRVKDDKIVNVKDWKPNKPFRLRVKATVRKNGKRTIKKRTYTYTDVNMVKALKEAGKELELLLESIRETLQREDIEADDRDEMMTFEKAFYRSMHSRKLAAEANNGKFKSYDNIEAFYINHLKSHIGSKKLNGITVDMVNRIRANMKHKNGDPFSAKTKLAVLQHISPVYTWFNDHSTLTVTSPAKITKGAVASAKNDREPIVEDVAPLFKAMYNYEYKEVYRSIFIWLLHGRRIAEVLSLRWEDIDLAAGTYTISADNSKVGSHQTYLLTKYQKATLTKPKKKGLVFPSIAGRQISSTVIWGNWKKVREAVGEFTLNGRTVGATELHIHDVRHLVTTEMLNRYQTPDEINGAILGHTRKGTTGIYAAIKPNTVRDTIEKLLDEVL